MALSGGNSCLCGGRTASYTQSGNNAADPTTSTDPIKGGAPEKDTKTDEGDETAQKEKNK